MSWCRGIILTSDLFDLMRVSNLGNLVVGFERLIGGGVLFDFCKLGRGCVSLLANDQHNLPAFLFQVLLG